MKRVIALALAAILLLTACGGPGGEGSAPPDTPDSSETVTPAPPDMPSPSEAVTSTEMDTPVPEVSPAASPSMWSVYTDWSALEPYEPPELIYQRWYEEPVHELRAVKGGYGTLVPFVGSFPPDLSWGGVYQYGLMTMDGAIVVDTVYSDVYRLSLGEGTRLPVLALMTTDPAADEEGWRYGIQRFGAAALDGSWSIPMKYDGIRAFSSEGFFLWGDGAVHVYGIDGRLRHSIPYSNVNILGDFEFERLDGEVLADLDGTTLRLINLTTGESVYVEGISGMIYPGDGLFPVRAADSGLWGCVDTEGRWAVPAKYEGIWMNCDGSGVASAVTDGTYIYVDREGNEYEEDPRPQQPQTQPDEWDMWVEPVEDSYTGETWYLRSLYSAGQPGYLIEDAQGKALGNMTVYHSRCGVVNGLFLNIDGETAGYKDKDGDWVFRILLAEAGD